ncbi:MAG: HI0074 family nucleotidyltransferase substrate-binding subunit [Methylococcales bacterium]|nr:HI0074 family nucleotidyltransferase substrate-binding subunit [Methylococcales bacterium]
MYNERLDLTAFNKVISSLGEALREYEKDKTNTFVRDSCIQRFEYCYEMSKKILIRYLKSMSDDPMEIDREKLSNLIRYAYKIGIVKHSWDEWDIYRENRNNTSHGYDEDIAVEIVEQLPAFYHEILFLSDRINANNEN